jgi:hypothetical protein
LGVFRSKEGKLSIKPKLALALTLAVGAGVFAIGIPVTFASHVHPRGATPIRVSLVPAFKACTNPNATHGGPLAFPSCGPPIQASNFLTIGTPDANGSQANAIGSILLQVNVRQGLVQITPSISDVRCLPSTDASVCNSPNATDGPDYSGELQMNATIRISDHYNGQNLNEAATVIDIPFPVNMFCSNTSSTSTGGVCIGGPQALCPPACGNPGQRAVVQLGQVEVLDGGPAGNPGSNPNDNTVFMRQGLFIP